MQYVMSYNFLFVLFGWLYNFDELKTKQSEMKISLLIYRCCNLVRVSEIIMKISNALNCFLLSSWFVCYEV